MKTTLQVFVIILGLGLVWACQNPQNQDKPLDNFPPEVAQIKVGNNSQQYKLEPLKKALRDLQANPSMASGFLGFSLRNARTGQLVLEHYGNKAFSFASCMKLVSTATALDLLGGEYTYKTDLQHSGQVSNGVLSGDIYIKGSGDPTLGSRIIPGQNLGYVLDAWVAKIKQKGIRQIKGGIIADEDFMKGDLPPAHWLWGDMGNYFGSPVYGLNAYDNTYYLYFTPGKLRWRAKILKTDPHIPNLNFVNEVTTAEAGTGDRASISGAPYDPNRYVSGTIPQGGTFRIKGSIPDPAWLIAHQLTAKLAKAGIKVSKPSSTTRLQRLNNESISQNRQLIARHYSPKLKEIVEYTNLYSVNLFAEALFKSIGYKQSKKARNMEAIVATRNFWANKGIAKDAFLVKDGSGLSPLSRLTPNDLSKLLALSTKSNNFTHFYNSLPVSGLSGTMRSFGANTKMRGKLRAKTGGLTGVVSFAGYFKTAKGELMSFSIVVNQYEGKYKDMRYRLQRAMEYLMEI